MPCLQHLAGRASIMADASCNAASLGLLGAARRPLMCGILQDPDLL